MEFFFYNSFIVLELLLFKKKLEKTCRDVDIKFTSYSVYSKFLGNQKYFVTFHILIVEMLQIKEQKSKHDIGTDYILSRMFFCAVENITY